MPAQKTIFVAGAGAWGTAIANAVASADRDVILFARDSAAAERIATSRKRPLTTTSPTPHTAHRSVSTRRRATASGASPAVRKWK